MLWTDETKINRIGSDGKVYTWKERGEPLSDRTTIPTVKHGGGGNIMVWGCMGWNGVGKLVEVQGTMDAEQYCDILDEGVVESFEKLGLEEEERIFQQDNDLKHTSKKERNGLKTTTFKFYPGLHSHLTSIPLNTSGHTSKTNCRNMKGHPKEYLNYGRGWWRSGMQFHQKCAKS